MSAPTELPENLLALLDKHAKQWCKDCVKVHPELLDDPENNVALLSDNWYMGGECIACGRVILNAFDAQRGYRFEPFGEL